MNFSFTDDQKAGKVGLNETNRRYALGSTMPTPPKLTMTPAGPVVIVGTQTFTVPDRSKVKEYFWLQK
jgi:hypothetical protein